jgi:hypothetical protein
MTALAGVIIIFVAPAAAILAGMNAFIAGTFGYAGITIFVGGVAARYSFVASAVPLKQLLLNLGIAAIVTSVFYGIFTVIYFL